MTGIVDIAALAGDLAYITATLIFSLTIARKAMRLFANMRDQDSPFSIENARLFSRMAVLMIIAWIVPNIVGQVFGVTFAQYYNTSFHGDYTNAYSLLVVLIFFAMSVLFKYGCELQTQVDETL